MKQNFSTILEEMKSCQCKKEKDNSVSHESQGDPLFNSDQQFTNLEETLN